MKAVLKFANKEKTLMIELSKGQRFVVGRGSNPEQGHVNDQKVSTKHCVFSMPDDYLKITDCDSKNGTYLNGIRIDDAEMFIGDEVKIGDTVITLDEAQMDQESIDELTFPGPAKNRISHELRVDFTGARIQNQLYNHAHPEQQHVSTPSQVKEIDIRKKAQSRIRLSKEEIRYRNQKLAGVARGVDIALLIVVFIVPIVYIMNAGRHDGIPFLGLSAEAVMNHKANLIGGAEIIFTGFFILVNMRLMEFSIGEKLVGIESKYNAQN